MIYYGYFVRQLPVEIYKETFMDGIELIRSKYPVECYFLKSGKDITYGKTYTHMSAYYGAAEGDIIDIFNDD